jgi:hypothetical protein
VLWPWRRARRTLEFFWGFAASVGLTYANRIDLLPLTPLMGAGTRRHVEHWMYGRLPGAFDGGLGQLVWEEERERNRFQICVVDLDSSLPYFHGVYLHPRRGLFPPYSEWLGSTPTRAVEVESSRFVERYELRAATDQDELLLRQLMSPTVVDWLAQHPLIPGFELKAGTLVVFVPRPLADAGNLTFLIDAATHLAQRVAGEVAERVARPAG